MASSHTRRSRGEGSVYHTAEGRWRASLIVSDPRTGRTVRRVVSGRSRAEAVRQLDVLKASAASGALPTGVTVAEFLKAWLEAERARVRASSWRQREGHVRIYIAPAIGSIVLARLVPMDVERMTAGMVADGLSPRTAAAARITLRRALGDALRDGFVTRNVAALARPPRVASRDLVAGRDYLELDDVRRVIVAAADCRVGALVTVAVLTGLRQGELLGLSWADVRLDDPASLTVHRSLARSYDGDGWELAEPKTPRSRRVVNLPNAAVEALRREHAWQDAAVEAAGSAWQDTLRDLVFSDELGRPLRGYNVNRAHHELLTAAGLPSIPFHGLRHSYATALLTSGVPLRVVADVLGHTTIVVTANTYAAVVPSLRREASDAMDRAMNCAS
jgi:integrase